MSEPKPDPNETPSHIEAMLSSGGLTLSAPASAAGDVFEKLQFVARLLASLPSRPTETTLVFRLNDESATVAAVGRGIVIGRSKDCDVSLPENRNLSRRHFEIRRDGERYLLSDLGSHNGTRIDGVKERIETRELRDGDVIRAGGIAFVFFTGVADC